LKEDSEVINGLDHVSICYPIEEKDELDKRELQLGKMVFALRTKHKVPNTSLNFISSEMAKILDGTSNLPDVSCLLQHAFLNINSKTNRTAFYVKNFGYKSPRQLLSLQRSRWANHFQSSFLHQRLIPYFQYIPIRQTLSTFFPNPNFRTMYFSLKPSTDGKMRSHIDTAHYRNHLLFKKFPRALRIQIFNDDLEVFNPLDSKTKIQQLVMFFFSILNLPPYLLSQLAHIHPFAI
jgi:hypothetical protein